MGRQTDRLLPADVAVWLLPSGGKKNFVKSESGKTVKDNFCVATVLSFQNYLLLFLNYIHSTRMIGF
jgi:hypothetical protein